MAYQESIAEELQHKAAEFVNRESNRSSLITVTRITLKERGRKADVYISVLPEEQEVSALAFLKRLRPAFREYLKDHTRLKTIPTVDFLIDFGEKNRRRLDELSG